LVDGRRSESGFTGPCSGVRADKPSRTVG